MLHLLPLSYVRELQKEYRQRALVTAAKLISFCLLVASLGMIPSLILMNTRQVELSEQSKSTVVRISDEDRLVASQFKNAVNRGVEAFAAQNTIASPDIDHVLGLISKGISIVALNIAYGEGGQEVEIQGIAHTRSDLSYFVRNIAANGMYTTGEIPPATFTKDKDLEFDIILKKQAHPLSS